MSYSDDVKKQRIADSWALRMRGPDAPTHTIGGAMEAARMKASVPAPRTFSTPISQPQPFWGRSNPKTSLASSPSNSASQRVQSQSTPWFPFVDNAFNKIPKAWYWSLLVVGALCGWGYGSSLAGDKTIGIAIMGAVAGLLLIPILRLGVKILLATMILGVFGLIV
jgi:hypothetical protein